MNGWMLTVFGFAAALVPCAIIALTKRTAAERLVGLDLAATVLVLLLLAVSEALERTYLYDLAFALALLSFGGGIVYARFLERWP